MSRAQVDVGRSRSDHSKGMRNKLANIVELYKHREVTLEFTMHFQEETLKNAASKVRKAVQEGQKLKKVSLD